MSNHPDSEAALENATLDLFTELGWQVLDCYYEMVARKPPSAVRVATNVSFLPWLLPESD